jgi:hypothetical protein
MVARWEDDEFAGGGWRERASERDNVVGRGEVGNLAIALPNESFDSLDSGERGLR